jgi:hypothetical protein
MRMCATMALDAAHRASIYEKLRPVLGDEDANVLMSEFPSVEADELVTKDFLRAELALTRADLRTEMAALRSDFGAEMAALRSDFGAEVAALRLEIARSSSRTLVWIGAAIAASTTLMASIGLVA